METETEKYIVVFDGNGQPTWIVPVVNPNGLVKHVRFNEHITSGIIEAMQRTHKSTGKPIKDPEHRWEVGLRLGLKDNGWELLADMFHAENADRKWSEYRRWMLAVDRDRLPAGPFPRKHLPAGVHTREAKQAPHQVAYTFDLGDEPEIKPDEVKPRRARADQSRPVGNEEPKPDTRPVP